MSTSLAKPFDSFKTTVASAYSPGAGSLALASVSGLSLSPGEWVRLTVVRGPAATETKLTHLKATGVSGSDLTGVEAIDGYSDVALQVGDRVEVRLAAGTISDIQDALNAAEDDIATLGSDVSTLDGAVSSLTSSVAGKATKVGSPTAGHFASLTVGGDLQDSGHAHADYAAASHQHAASDLTSGTIATARLGSGTANASTFLRGDQTYAAALQPSNNLSDLGNAGTARTNLGLGTAATQAASAFAQVANNLSDLANAGTARTNLGVPAIVATTTDNAIVRSDGTAGQQQATGVVIDDNDALYGFNAGFNDQTGTTYTLQASDKGKVVTLTNASPITLTLPNSLPKGFNCLVVQSGAGQVTFSAASGASIVQRQSFNKAAGQHAQVGLLVTGNSGGASAVYNLSGDMA